MTTSALQTCTCAEITQAKTAQQLAVLTFCSLVMRINVKVVHIHYVYVFIAGEISFMTIALQ